MKTNSANNLRLCDLKNGDHFVFEDGGIEMVKCMGGYRLKYNLDQLHTCKRSMSVIRIPVYVKTPTALLKSN